MISTPVDWGIGVVANAIAPLIVMARAPRECRRTGVLLAGLYLACLLGSSLLVASLVQVSRWSSDVITGDEPYSAGSIVMSIALLRPLPALGVGFAVSWAAMNRPAAAWGLALALPLLSEVASALTQMRFSLCLLAACTFGSACWPGGCPEDLRSFQASLNLAVLAPPFMSGVLLGAASTAIAERRAP